MLLGQFQGGALQIVAPAERATTDNVLYVKPDWK